MHQEKFSFSFSTQHFSTRFLSFCFCRVVRYEDLAEDTSSVTEEILRFLGFEMHPRVNEFIKEYTQTQEKGNLNIRRNSSYTASRWTEQLSWDSIEKIQNNTVCKKAIRFWGYKTVTNVTVQQECVPYLNRFEYNFERLMETKQGKFWDGKNRVKCAKYVPISSNNIVRLQTFIWLTIHARIF